MFFKNDYMSYFTFLRFLKLPIFNIRKDVLFSLQCHPVKRFYCISPPP